MGFSPRVSDGADADADGSIADLYETIVALRAIVGRYGETDINAWWECEALSPHGQQALRQICPRTAAWRGLELTVIAARRRQKASVRDIPAVTLFDFGAVVESEISRVENSLNNKGADIPAAGMCQ